MTDLLKRKPWIGLLLAVLVYASLILPTVAEHGMANDELIDMRVAMSYVYDDWGWLRDIDLDASQTRLPMYATALANLVLGTESLMVSRLLSVLCGILTLVGVYWFCARELDATKGVLAALLLAGSAYFLAFTRVAMTEGDAWVPLSGMGLALATAQLARRPSTGMACTTALVCGLVVSIKFTAAIWLPAAFVGFLMLARRREPGPDSRAGDWLPLLPAAAGVGAVIGGWWYASPEDLFELDSRYEGLEPGYLLGHITAAGAGWLLFIAVCLYRRRRLLGRFAAGITVGVGALLTFFVIPPVHTTNPGVVEQLVIAFLQNKGGLPEGMRFSSLMLHVLIILLKSGPAMGMLFLASLAAALWSIPKRPVLVLPLLLIVSCVSFYVLMGRAQTFYMIGIMPFLAILAADALGELLKHSRPAFTAIVGLVSLNAAVDITRSYPDLHLNGYQWLGERYIADRSTLGYKSVAQTPSDGTAQVIRWAIDNVEPGRRVVTFLRQRIAIYYLGPSSGVRFQVKDGFHRNVTLEDADYVLLHINSTLRQFESSDRPLAIEAREHTMSREGLDGAGPDSIYLYPFDAAELERDFEKVFSVQRAFGLEVASVWRRKGAATEAPAGSVVGP